MASFGRVVPFSPLLILDQIHFTFTFNYPFFNLDICFCNARIHVILHKINASNWISKFIFDPGAHLPPFDP
ncbi:hypothetical protein T12_1031 [Trichinella patagoniensis]|uniref:Uncharacterized protein n=1 Tax=Trichinella patagoniensis TaxID=990121 RepID=A0A0V0Z1L5_9BILA|nr:hypothetical protein T12_1031 [Trichinella patagoniensis]